MKSSSEHKKDQKAEKRISLESDQMQPESTTKKKPTPSAREVPQGKNRPALKPGDKKIVASEIKVRQATEADAEFVSKLLFMSFPRFAQNVIGLGKEERAKKMIRLLFAKDDQRFSYENTAIAENKGRRIGLLVSLPGKNLGQANRKFFSSMMKLYSMRGKLALLSRTLPMAFIKEAGRDEYLISNLAVLPRFQEQGYGRALVKYAEKKARAQGYARIAVMMDVQNTHARRFFEHLGYKVQSVVLESNRRVKTHGIGYQRMRKNL